MRERQVRRAGVAVRVKVWERVSSPSVTVAVRERVWAALAVTVRGSWSRARGTPNSTGLPLASSRVP